MQVPGSPSLLFLVYLLLFLPWAAFRGTQRLREAREEGRLRATREEGSARASVPRRSIWAGTLLSQALLFGLAWFVGGGFGYRIFALPTLGARELLAAVAALVACFGVRALVRASRTEEERRRLLVYRLAPRTGGEWALWVATVLAASVAEEAAYRGVGMSILWYSLGSPWAAALICATAFSLAHWAQGGKSGVAIFAIALVMHALVAFTGTLVLAMVVHAAYDLVAGFLIAREAERYDREAAAASA